MLKYAAHSAYCALICALLLRAEAAALRQATEDSPALLIWFLRAFVSLNLALFCTTLAVFDLLGVCYSQLSDMLRPPPLLKSIWGAFAFMLALAANLSVCVAGMWANRVIFGFQLQYELTGATMLLLAYNVANMRYNATSSSRLQSFWHERGLDQSSTSGGALGLATLASASGSTSVCSCTRRLWWWRPPCRRALHSRLAGTTRWHGRSGSWCC